MLNCILQVNIGNKVNNIGFFDKEYCEQPKRTTNFIGLSDLVFM